MQCRNGFARITNPQRTLQNDIVKTTKPQMQCRNGFAIITNAQRTLRNDIVKNGKRKKYTDIETKSDLQYPYKKMKLKQYAL
jgi:hypothetical protein